MAGAESVATNPKRQRFSRQQAKCDVCHCDIAVANMATHSGSFACANRILKHRLRDDLRNAGWHRCYNRAGGLSRRGFQVVYYPVHIDRSKKHGTVICTAPFAHDKAMWDPTTLRFVGPLPQPFDLQSYAPWRDFERLIALKVLAE